jgi:hypothetical protein
VAKYPCDCGGTVEIDTRNLGPSAAQLLLPPLHVLCAGCRERFGLEVNTDGGRPWLLRDGREYREVGGAFVRSDNPRIAHVYFRDRESDGQGESH